MSEDDSLAWLGVGVLAYMLFVSRRVAPVYTSPNLFPPAGGAAGGNWGPGSFRATGWPGPSADPSFAVTKGYGGPGWQGPSSDPSFVQNLPMAPGATMPGGGPGWHPLAPSTSPYTTNA